MLTYEYLCQKCGRTSEVEQRITDPKVTRCPRPGCDGTVTRLISGAPLFVLKGTRWARDGY